MTQSENFLAYEDEAITWTDPKGDTEKHGMGPHLQTVSLSSSAQTPLRAFERTRRNQTKSWTRRENKEVKDSEFWNEKMGSPKIAGAY
jgi:hypothetical protein